MERISDHAVNLAELASEMDSKQIRFSPQAEAELQVCISAIHEIIDMTHTALADNSPEVARKVEPLEEVIDVLTEELKVRHINRLQNGLCTLEMGFIFNDCINNFERVADHCSNIAVAMIELESDSFDTHQYLISLKDVRSHSFDQYYEEYRKKFALPDD